MSSTPSTSAKKSWVPRLLVVAAVILSAVLIWKYYEKLPAAPTTAQANQTPSQPTTPPPGYSGPRPVLTVNNHTGQPLSLDCQASPSLPITPRNYRWVDFVGPVPCEVKNNLGNVIKNIPPLSANLTVDIR